MKLAEFIASYVVMFVEWIATHFEPHPDEALAIWMAVRFGEQRFPGVGRAWRKGNVLFCEAGRAMPIKLPCKREHILEAGIGGGWCDEHQDEQSGEECTATLMADKLWLRGDAALEKMVQWTLANDQDAAGTSFDWSDIMKAGFHAGMPDLIMLKRSFRVFNAVYNKLSGCQKRIDISGMPDYWHLAAEWVLSLTKNDFLNNPEYDFSGPLLAAKATGLDHSELISWMLKYEVNIKGLDGQPPREPAFMEIPSIVEALYHDGASVGEVTHFVREMLNARLAEQKLFIRASDEWAANRKMFWVQQDGVTYKVAVVTSDNRRIVSAVRASSDRPHAVIRMLPKTGHISLFANGLDVMPIAVRLRAACWAAVGNTSILSDERLRHEWTIEEVPQLCLQRKAGNILNASLTAPHVEPIRLSLKTYIAVVKAGLREVARATALHRKETKRRARQRHDARKADVA